MKTPTARARSTVSIAICVALVAATFAVGEQSTALAAPPVNWVEQARMLPPPYEAPNGGSAGYPYFTEDYGRENSSTGIDLSGNNAVIAGDPVVDLWERSPDGSWGYAKTLGITPGGGTARIDGAVAVIGGPASINPIARRGGWAGVFRRTLAGDWVQEAELHPTDIASGDRFGSSIALDGDLLVVGAANDDTAAGETGAAYAYEYNGTGWVQKQRIVPPDALAPDRFGESMAISGTTLVISSFLHAGSGKLGDGAVYVYEWDGSQFQQVQKLDPPASWKAFNPGQGLGYMLGIDGDRMVIGPAGTDVAAVRVMERGTDGIWVLDEEIEIDFGSPQDTYWTRPFTDVSGDRIVIGSADHWNQSFRAGKAWTYIHDGSNWVVESDLAQSVVDQLDYFGNNVALDGDTALAAAPRTNKAGSEGTTQNEIGAVFAFVSEDWSYSSGLQAPAMGLGPNPARQYDTVAITATANDTETGGANIAGAEYQVDGGPWMPMAPVDGAFDSVEEIARFDTSFDTIGTFTVCTRAYDADTDISPPTCIDLVVEEAGDGPLALTITRVERVGASVEVEPEFFVDAQVGDVNGSTVDGAVTDDAVEPFWVVGGQSTGGDRLVSFEVRDFDGDGNPTELLDADPLGGTSVDIFVDTRTGKWDGDAVWPENCSTGDSDLAVKVCWDISVWSESGDWDGDGLLDAWETYGLNADGNGTIDLPLQDWGAQVDHKDLFWEIDWMPGTALSASSLETVIDSFEAAPIDAAGLANPDGLPGINLHIDTAPARDRTRYEDADPVDMCNDGLDNDGDATTDADDPECQRSLSPASSLFRNVQGFARESTASWPCDDGIDNNGDGLADDADPVCTYTASEIPLADSGANEMPTTVIPDLGSDEWADAKAANFDPTRRWVFRYMISAVDFPGNTWGGWGNRPGPNTIIFQYDAATVMHEFGHNLGLQHGGGDALNRKPNYVSIMNYDLALGGIPTRDTVSGWPYGVTDFSPARDGYGNRYAAPLPTLDENAIEDGVVLDATNPAHRTVIGTPNCVRMQVPLDSPIDWNGDGDIAASPFELARVRGQGGNFDCSDEDLEVLESYDDWAQMRLPIHKTGNGQAVIGPAPPEIEFRTEDLLAGRREINSTDLQVSASLTPDPPVAGQPATLQIDVTNLGPNPADAAIVSVELPVGATHVSGDCRLGDELDPSKAYVLFCAAGGLEVGESLTRTAIITLPAGSASLVVATENVLGDDTGTEPNDGTTVDVEVVPDDSGGAECGAPGSNVISIGDGVVFEGDAAPLKGARKVKLPVSISDPSATEITVDYTVYPGTATFPGDLKTDPSKNGVPKTKTLKIKPQLSTGVTPAAKTINVPTLADVTVEGDESFTVVLSNPTGGYTLGRSTGTGTIIDDDGSSGQEAAVTSASTCEANDSLKGNKVPLQVSLAEPSIGVTTVTIDVTEGTATGGFKLGGVYPLGSDFKGFKKLKIVKFNPGQVQKQVTISTFADTDGEADETILATIIAADVPISPLAFIGIGVILNDD